MLPGAVRRKYTAHICCVSDLCARAHGQGLATGPLDVGRSQVGGSDGKAEGESLLL